LELADEQQQEEKNHANPRVKKSQEEPCRTRGSCSQESSQVSSQVNSQESSQVNSQVNSQESKLTINKEGRECAPATVKKK